jgi:hypothetical protein
MTHIQPIDETLDRLDQAVSEMSSDSSIAALKHISAMAKAPACSPEVVDQAREITSLCDEVHDALRASLDIIEDDGDDEAVSHLEHALDRLQNLFGFVAEAEAHGHDIETPKASPQSG